MVAHAPHSHSALKNSWNREPGDDSDDQGKGSDHDDRPQRDPDCEWHATISLHVRSDKTRGGFLYHTENLAALAGRSGGQRTMRSSRNAKCRVSGRRERSGKRVGRWRRLLRHARRYFRMSQLWMNLYKGYEGTGWQGIGAPRNTPTEIIDELTRRSSKSSCSRSACNCSRSASDNRNAMNEGSVRRLTSQHAAPIPTTLSKSRMEPEGPSILYRRGGRNLVPPPKGSCTRRQH
jgi:hypothetical protein